jgi:hypothetical protein
MTHRCTDGYCHLHRKLAKSNSKPLNSVGAKSAMLEKAARKCGCISGIVPAGKAAIRLAKIQRERKKEQKRHRDVLNFSSEWIRSLLALYQPNAGAASTRQKKRAARN